MILVDLEEAESILNNDRSMSIDLSERDAKIREELGYQLKSDMEEIFKGTTQGRFDWCDAYLSVWKVLMERCGIDKEMYEKMQNLATN